LEGFASGEVRGEARGKLEGKAERDLEIARNMKQKGYSVKDIADLTDLSYADIARLN